MDAAAVLEVLALARAFVESGWCQGAIARDDKGRTLSDSFNADAEQVCLFGALTAAACQTGVDYHPVTRIVADCLRPYCLPFDYASLMAYNDDPGITRTQVLALFDQAAARVGGK